VCVRGHVLADAAHQYPSHTREPAAPHDHEVRPLAPGCFQDGVFGPPEGSLADGSRPGSAGHLGRGFDLGRVGLVVVQRPFPLVPFEDRDDVLEPKLAPEATAMRAASPAVSFELFEPSTPHRMLSGNVEPASRPTRTEQGACRRTCVATLPMRTFPPRSPASGPTQITSTAWSAASSTSASAGSPATTLALAGTLPAATASALRSTASAFGSTSASSWGRPVSMT
jgi:hypothetical protein